MAAKVNGVVSGGHPKTVQAGKIILENGGNAFDAAVGALLASFVAEPCMSSAGGGLFLTLKQASGKCVVIDGFCHTPGNKSPEDAGRLEFYPLWVDFGTLREAFHVGMGSVAVPGAVAGLFNLHENYASMPLSEIAAPALEMCRQGVVIDEFQSYDFKLLENILRLDERESCPFFENGQLKVEGALLVQQGMADFLENLVKEGRDFFYKGEICRQIADASAELGGWLIAEDLENYQCEIRTPLKFRHAGYDVWTNPAPSAGGTIIALIMSMLNDGPSTRSLSVSYAGQLESALRQAYDARNSDPSSWSKDFRDAVNNLGGGAALVNNNKIESIHGSTTHFNVIDEYGNSVACSSTNGEGSGVWIKGSGVQLNNMLGEAALFPNGFHSWTPNRRVSSLMAPTIAERKTDRSIIALGTGGAGRIPSAISQVLHQILDYNSPIKQAVETPRMHWQHGQLNLESGFPPNFKPDSRFGQIVNWNRLDMYFGGVHTSSLSKGTFEGAGDSRRSGASILSGNHHKRT